MLIAAAVCPHPPLLIPQATGAPGCRGAELDRLRTACHRAVAALVGERPDLLVVVGGTPKTPKTPKTPATPTIPTTLSISRAPNGPAHTKTGYTAEYPPDAAGSLHEFGVRAAVGGDPRTPKSPRTPESPRTPKSPQDSPDTEGPPVLPLSLAIGKWLLSRASREVPRVAWWGIASHAPTAECGELGEKLAALAPRVGMLAMGDGPGCRARGVPGAADPRADRYEARVAASLAAADSGALAALDPSQDGPLFIAGRAAWQVLAGAAGQGHFDADLRYFAAPFEVTYFVASWCRRLATP
jgi:hypothetical protein